MDPATHRDLLDAYGRLKSEAHGLRALWRSWQDALEAREVAARRLAEAQRDELFLRHAVEELDALDPRSGEEAELAEKRNRLMHREKLIEAVNVRSEEHTSELQTLMRISYAVFCLKKKNKQIKERHTGNK